MELTGNLKEPVMIPFVNYTNFTGLHGNGALSSSGNCDVSSWIYGQSEVTTSTYHSRVMSYRGGSWDISSGGELIISNRDWYTNNVTSSYYDWYQFGRSSTYGGRCVRTAP
jgi:hypothetical protein